MRCLKCEYPLWDLAPGRCPECGESFDPTDHRFKNGSVAFCCPHCDQTYFGEGEDGHLVPQQFDCVSCGQRISESECIVRPREDGSREDVVTAVLSPWHDGHRRLRSRFYGTLGLSLFRPGRLGAGFPVNLPPFGAFGFVSLIFLVILVVGVLPLILVVAISMSGVGMPGAMTPGLLIGVIWDTAMAFVVTIVIALLVLLTYGTIVHGILRLGGSTNGGLMRTIGSLGFGSGPLVFLGIPIFGPYCLHVPMLVWMMVTSTLVLRAAQGVSGLRAALAVVLPVLVAVTIAVTAVVITTRSTIQQVQNAFAMMPVDSYVYRLGAEAITIEPKTILDSGDWSNGPPSFADVEGLVTTGDSSTPPDAGAGLFGDVVVRPVSGPGFEGWWVPGLLVIEGPQVRVIAVVTGASANGAPTFRSMHVFKGSEGSSPSIVIPFTSNDELKIYLRATLEAPNDRDDFPGSFIDDWLDASDGQELEGGVSFP